MRILATNPDTIGDVILRQPLYRALADAGHELMLAVRPLLAPVIGSIAPGARVLQVSANVYDPKLTPSDTRLDDVVAAAREFAPDVLMVAPYQWTALCERLAAELKDARVVAMSGRAFVHPEHGPGYESKLRVTERVQVAEEVPEIRKNELLASAVLGRAVGLPDPRLEASPEQVAGSEAVLSRLGLAAGGYVVACVGETRWTTIRNWRVERWGGVLRHWAQRHGRKFLLIGNRDEAESAAGVREAMGDQAGQCAEWFGAGEGELDVLLGLIAGSTGYIGRDTGPMHIAAAMGKAVIAVFGGGTWPRFLPQVDPSISITLGVPCAGCNWVCHLPSSYCIKEVPVDEVVKAVDDLESGAAAGRAMRVISPDSMLLARIGREGAISGRAHLTQLAVTRRSHMEQTQSLSEQLDRTAREAGRAEVLEKELEATRSEMARRESLLRQRLAASEAMFRAREQELEGRIAEVEAMLSNAIGMARNQVESEVRQMVATEAATVAAREADLRTKYSRTVAELSEVQAQATDLQLRLQQVQAEHAALAKWNRQVEQELEVVRPRLHELMSSRWRRYGQRLHLCMVLPWEKDLTSSNGKH
jgi:ADP-heptose:LPS heptosyltransferase